MVLNSKVKVIQHGPGHIQLVVVSEDNIIQSSVGYLRGEHGSWVAHDLESDGQDPMNLVRLLKRGKREVLDRGGTRLVYEIKDLKVLKTFMKLGAKVHSFIMVEELGVKK